MKAQHIVIALFTALLTLSGVAQEEQIKQDLKAINVAYAEQKESNLEVEYRVFKTLEAQEPTGVERGHIYRKGAYVYQKMGAQESMLNESNQVIIDHDEKKMVLAPMMRGEVHQDTEIQAMIQQMESVLQVCERMERKELDAQQVRLSFYLKSGVSTYKTVHLTFNAETHGITHIDLSLDTANFTSDQLEMLPQRMVMSFKDVPVSEELKKDCFALRRYAKKQGDAYVGVGAYAAFEVINYLN